MSNMEHAASVSIHCANKRGFSLVEPNRFSYQSAARLENHSPRLRSTPGSVAFSLVELSIVLVILGLLVGGVLSGQSLIRAAELRAVNTELQRYVTASYTFRDKYFALPGDMPNATQFWGRATATADCVTNSSAAVAAPGACDGSGDGRIEGVTVAGQSNEYHQYWKHLALAGLIEGNYTGIRNASGNDSTPAINVPASKISRAGYTIAFWNNTGGTGDSFNYALNYGNHLSFGVSNSTSGMTGQVLKPEELWNIDTKMDDGRPGTGKLISITNITWGATGCTTSANATDFNGAYNLANSNVVCAIRYIIQ